MGAISVGILAALLLWGMLTDWVGERPVMVAARLLLALTGAFGAGVNAASGRAVLPGLGAALTPVVLGAVAAGLEWWATFAVAGLAAAASVRLLRPGCAAAHGWSLTEAGVPAR